MSTLEIAKQYFRELVNPQSVYVLEYVQQSTIDYFSKLDASLLKNEKLIELIKNIGETYFSYSSDLASQSNGSTIIESVSSFLHNGETFVDNYYLDLVYRSLKGSFNKNDPFYTNYVEESNILENLLFVCRNGTDSLERNMLDKDFSDAFVTTVTNIRDVVAKDDDNDRKYAYSFVYDKLGSFLKSLSNEKNYKNIVHSPRLWKVISDKTGDDLSTFVSELSNLSDFFTQNQIRYNRYPVKSEILDSLNLFDDLKTTMDGLIKKPNTITGYLPLEYTFKSPFTCGTNDKIVVLNKNIAYISQKARDTIALVPIDKNLMLCTDQAYNCSILAIKLRNQLNEYLLLGHLSGDTKKNIIDDQVSYVFKYVSKNGFTPMMTIFSPRTDSKDELSEDTIKRYNGSWSVRRRDNLARGEIALVSAGGIMFSDNNYILWDTPIDFS